MSAGDAVVVMDWTRTEPRHSRLRLLPDEEDHTQPREDTQHITVWR